jgi:hypothetical protein
LPHLARIIQRLLIALTGVFLLAVPPVRAQSTDPTPWITELRNAVEAFGVGGFMMIVGALMLLGIVWFVFRPAFKNMTEAQRERTEVNRALLRYLEESKGIIAQNTTATTTFQQYLTTQDGKAEAEMKTQRETGVKDVNTHVDKAHQTTDGKIDELSQKVDTVIQNVESLQQTLTDRMDAGDKTLDGALSSVQQQLKGIKQAVDSLHAPVENTNHAQPQEEVPNVPPHP